jgi:hypothetical protein
LCNGRRGREDEPEEEDKCAKRQAGAQNLTWGAVAASGVASKTGMGSASG